MATYGSFPGVQVTTQSGGVPSVVIGAEEKLVIFGQADYDASNNVNGTASTNSPEQINAPQEADDKFGSGSELADAMKEAIANGANIDYLYGVAVDQVQVTGESFNGTSGSTGTLANYSILEDTSTVQPQSGSYTFEFRYDGAPSTPSADDTVFLNPLTGEYAVTSGTVSTAASNIDYEYHDWDTAFSDTEVLNVVNENETGVFWALAESDKVSSDLQDDVQNLRKNYQLVNSFCFAEPNDQKTLSASDTTDTNGGAHPLYDTANYGTANQSISQEYFYKLAPARLGDKDRKTIGGGLAGLYAGKPINDAVYNEVVSGYSSLRQSFSKTDADNMRSEDIIPVRSGGSVRVRGNRSTAFSSSSTVAAEFWTRRIADRVILIAKEIGDKTLGKINDSQTRTSAQRLIEAEMQDLVEERLIKPNTSSTQNWSVQVYEDSSNADQVNIDISFTPYGLAKRIEASVTVS